MIKAAFKILAGLFSLVTLIIVLAVVLLSVGALNKPIERLITDSTNAELNGELRMEEIKGNLLSHFSLNKVQILQDKDTLLTVDAIDIRYNILSLFKKDIDIKSLHLLNPSLNAVESSDSGWNFERLVPASEDSVSAPFTWKVIIGELGINNLNAFIDSRDTSLKIPYRTKLDAQLGIIYDKDLIFIQSERFELNTTKPGFELKKFTFTLEMTDSVVTWSDLDLHLANSVLRSEGIFPIHSPYTTEVSLVASPLDLSDFKPWLKGVHGDPDIEFEMKKVGDKNIIDLLVTELDQSIKINGDIIHTEKEPAFNLKLTADKIDGEHWTHDPALKSSINGELNISGNGDNIKTNSIKAEAGFRDLQYENYSLKVLDLTLNKNKDKVAGNLSTSSPFGDLKSDFNLSNLFSKPVYDISLKLDNIDLGRLLDDRRFKSRINLDFVAKGEGINPDSLNTSLFLKSRNSVLFDQPINDLTADIRVDHEEYSINRLYLKTPYILAEISGNGNITEKNKIDFKLKTQNVETVASALKLNPLTLDSEISGKISGPADALSIRSQVLVSKFSSDSMVMESASIDINSILPVSTKNSSIDLSALNLSAETKVKYARYNEYSIEDLIFLVEKKQNKINGSVDLRSFLGKINGEFDVLNLFSAPEYDIHMKIAGMDLADILLQDSINSDINLEMLVKGKGLEPGSMTTSLTLISEGSSIAGSSFENFNSEILYDAGNYSISGLSIKSPNIQLTAVGQGNINHNNKLDLSLEFQDICDLAKLAGLDKLEATGKIENTISGPMDSLVLSSTILIDNIKYDTIKIEKLEASLDGKRSAGVLSGNAVMGITNFKIQESVMQSITIHSQLEGNRSFHTLNFNNSDSSSGKLSTEIEIGDKTKISIPEIDINFYSKQWSGGDSSSILILKDSFIINNLAVRSGESAILANGTLTKHGDEDLILNIQNLKLERIPGVQFLPYKLSGKLNSIAEISGTSENPIIKFSLNIDKPQIDSIKLDQLQVSAGYEGELFTSSLLVNDNLSGSIKGELKIPGQLKVKDNVFEFFEDEQFTAGVEMDEFYLENFRFLFPEEIDLKGRLSLNVNLHNTINDPNVAGHIQLDKGSLDYSKYGIQYRNITIKNRMDESSFIIDSMVVNSGQGNFNINGTAKIKSWIEGDIESLNFNIKSNNFKAVNSESMRADINSDLLLFGSLNKPSLKGSIDLIRSSFNSDLLIKDFGEVSDYAQQPLLVQAKINSKREKLTKAGKIYSDTIKETTPEVYKNLTADIDIRVPRNTWVKGKNMNFEISGNLKLLKKGEQLDLFGDLSVKRGFYKIYGKKLEFEQGKITFTGGKIENPIINFNISYKFRDQEKRLRKLNVIVTGRVEQPEMKYLIDEESISEKEAISFLLFNKDLNQLDNRENSSVDNSNLDMAKNLAIGQITGVLKDQLQSTFGLDVIEITGENNWNQTRASVGKYITNNLFLSYEQTFAMNKKDKAVNPYKVSMEYQILPWLYFQGTNQSSNSGFDLVFRWTWK